MDSPPAAKMAFYAALFGARTDVYALRWDNARTGRSGWMPAVRGGWRKGRPAAEREYLPLTSEVLTAHLSGEIEIGIYPMLDGDRCWWLAADFDGSAAMLDALAYLKAARAAGAPAALEVSRSGLGAHAWLFFNSPVLATTARLFLAAPVAFKGRLVQYAGRVLRPHPGKTTAEVHDYHDVLTGVLASSLAKRAPGYTSLGFPDPRRMPVP